MSEREIGTPEAPFVSLSRVLALDEEARTVRHVVSTARMDRNNRIVEPAGWSLTNFREAPRVLANHDYTIEAVIGRAIDTKVEGNALVSTTQFDTEGLGNVAFRLVQSGLVNSWSVGWISLKSHRFGEVEDCAVCASALKKVEWGRHFVKQDLLEYSLVAIPANPDAVMGLQTAGLVRGDEVAYWFDTFRSEPEIPERSAKFYEALNSASRNVARCAAALRMTQRIRREP
ncbi:MAG: HK97 family phage prohead protease [Parvularculaceae bacterium]|nr:HK97 family phage prohead protease [Parvularculaceae bacterium]